MSPQSEALSYYEAPCLTLLHCCWSRYDCMVQVAWATVPRKDSPVIVGAAKPGKPRYIGVNSSIPQECKPSRVLDASGMLTSINATSTKSAAGGMAASSMQAMLAAGLALLAAALAL